MLRVKPVWLALALLLCAVSSANAQKRQYYGKVWQKQGGYYYRNYYHKPSPKAEKYRYHVVVYYPSKPKHYYYYNPYKKTYWGRFDTVADGYSALAEADQKPTVSDIAESKFPKPGPMPAIPDGEDNVPMEKPPQGLPPDETEEISKDKFNEMGVGPKKEEPPRQAYSGWVKHENSYYSCHYHQPVYGGDYKSHKTYYYPSQPKYVYYYNPYSKKYWGRYDLEAKGYSLLAEKDRAGELKDIPESAFPEPGELPPIPESKDKVKIAAPPAVPGKESAD